MVQAGPRLVAVLKKINITCIRQNQTEQEKEDRFERLIEKEKEDRFERYMMRRQNGIIEVIFFFDFRLTL